MRLIDADTLMKKSFELEGYRVISYVDLIEAQTAYDVEKVIDQLEDEEEYSCADIEEYAEAYGLDLSEYDDWYFQGLKRAITLVKRGVVS